MLKRYPGTLFLVICLILIVVPATSGAPSTPVTYAAEDGSGDYNAIQESSSDINGDHQYVDRSYEENTTITDDGQMTVDDSILMDSAEQEIEDIPLGHDQISPEDDQISPEEVSLNDTIVTNTVPEQEFETEEVAGYVIDNRLREASPNTVYKEKSYLDIGGRPGIGRYRELLLFDLSEYSDAENISRATLSLHWFYPDGKERPKDTIIEVYRPAAAWNPENVTWNSRDSDVLWVKPGGDWFDRNRVPQGDAPYATITLKAGDLPDNRYYELNVTDLVKEYVSGRFENTGFMIRTRTESADYVAFHSSETEKEEQHPKLNIEYA